MKNRLILLDGNSLFNRAYFALPPLMNKDGFYTNAIYGFAMMLNNILENYEPTHMAIAFDLKAPTFRHKSYEDYKATRKGMSDELRMQVEPLKKMVDAYGITRVEFEGYEADDIIGTLSKLAENDGFEVMIVTGDKDALQLASQSTAVYITKKGITELERYTDAEVIEKYELTPLEFIDLKALMGDKSDNIKGVAGIGEKTGIKLIKEFKSVEGIYEHIDEIKGSLRTKLENDRESAFLSKKLATIVRDMPLEADMDELLVKSTDYERLSEMFREFEFTTLLNKLKKEQLGKEQPGKDQQEPGREKKSADIERADIIYEYDRQWLDSVEGADIIINMQAEKGEESNCPDIEKLYIKNANNIYVIDADNIADAKAILENPSNRIIGHGLKNIYKALKKCGIRIANIFFDIEIAEYLIDSNNTNFTLEYLNNKYGLENFESLEEIIGKGKKELKLIFADKERLSAYFINSLYSIEGCYQMMGPEIEKQELSFVFNEIEMKLVRVLSDMEQEGFLVDTALLRRLSHQYEKEIAELESSIYSLAGEPFNINSPKQLGVILFDKLALPVIKKTKTGYSTNIEVLEALQGKHEIIEHIMEYRQITKLKSTYIDGLLGITNDKTGRIHTTFNQTIASTGRLSSSDPNLQNIPVRTERGRALREVFISKEGYLLIDSDYSQIELRILAHLANDEIMLDSFRKYEDIHTRTASEVFNVPLDEVTPELRSAAKAVNFGIVYGISDFGLSNNLGISKNEAKKYIETYLDKYVNIKAFLSDVVTEVERTGYSTTIFGRRRYIPELKAKNMMVRNFGKRLAMNTPIQGTAADIIKLAMIKVYEYLEESGADAKLILQVHDELILEAAQEQAESLKLKIKEIMEGVAELLVDLRVDIKTGKNWLETK